MNLGDLFRERDFVLSVEIFPPKTEKGDQTLAGHLECLTAYDPAFVSCTYGAGGSTRGKTLDWCKRIQSEFGRTATAHFTCVSSTRDDLVEWLQEADQAGVRNIMALRGDPPEGQKQFSATEGGLEYANELVELIRSRFPHFGIGVAGYPEKHPEAPDIDIDRANLKRKVDAGADAVFTQLFYVNENFLRFRDQCAAEGIEVPIVPGIMPITEFARIKRITSMCGAVFPTELAARLEAVQDDADAQFEIGVDYAIEQCRDLIDKGVAGIHFYVLNKSSACERILGELGMTPA